MGHPRLFRTEALRGGEGGGAQGLSFGLGWFLGFESGLFFSLSLLFFGFAVDVFVEGANIRKQVVVLSPGRLLGMLC